MLSIIIPTYNCAPVLSGMFDSILCQTFTDYEVVIVDGASVDGTMEIVYAAQSRFPKGRLQYISAPDGGIYDAMNKGISVSRGQWLYFMGADDRLYDSQSLMQLSSFLHSPARVVMCDVFSPRHGRCRPRFSIMTWLHNTIHHQGLVYHRSVFSDRKYDVSLHVMGDYEFNLWLYDRGCPMSRARFVLSTHLPGGKSGTVRWENYSEEIRVRNRYLHNPFARVFCAMVSVLKYGIKTSLC